VKSATYQRGFGLTGYLAAGSAVAILSITVLWQAERAKTASLEGEIKGLHGELDIMEANQAKLETVIEDQRKTVEAFAELGNKQADRAQELTGQLFDAQAESYKRQNEINQLRATETKRSILQPYGSGNRAHERITQWMQSMAGAESRDDTHGNGADVNQADIAADAETSTD